MKNLLYAAFPLLLLTLLGSCSKKKVEPAALNDTKWRLTSQTREEYLKGSSQKYTYSRDPGCMGKNIIMFTASGQVLWTRETGGCSRYPSGPPTDKVWGQWQLKDSPRQLRIVVKDGNLPGLPPNYSALPVLIGRGGAPGVEGSYDVLELDATKLTLSKTYIMTTQTLPTQQDSVFVSYDTFTRVAE